MNYDSLYNYLERNLSGIFSRSEQLNKLRELATKQEPLNHLVNKLENDNDLASQFYSHFAKAQNEYVSIIASEYNDKEEAGKFNKQPKFRIINESTRNINSEILTNWEAALKASSLYTLNGTPDSKKFLKILNDFNRQLNKLDRKSSFEVSDMKGLEAIFNNMKFEVTAEGLYNEYKSHKSGNKNKFFKTMKGNNGIKNTIENFSQGKDPFTISNQAKNLKTFVDLMSGTKTDYLQGSILNAENNMMYSYVKPAALNRMLTRFNTEPEAAAQWYKEDPSYEYSLLVQQLQDKSPFRVIIADSIKLKDEFRGTRYKSFDSTRYDISQLNMFLNSGNNKAFYAFPTLSDSTINYYLENEKFDIEKSKDHLFQLYRFEES